MTVSGNGQTFWDDVLFTVNGNVISVAGHTATFNGDSVVGPAGNTYNRVSASLAQKGHKINLDMIFGKTDGATINTKHAKASQCQDVSGTFAGICVGCGISPDPALTVVITQNGECQGTMTVSGNGQTFWDDVLFTVNGNVISVAGHTATFNGDSVVGPAGNTYNRVSASLAQKGHRINLGMIFSKTDGATTNTKHAKASQCQVVSGTYAGTCAGCMQDGGDIDLTVVVAQNGDACQGSITVSAGGQTFDAMPFTLNGNVMSFYGHTATFNGNSIVGPWGNTYSRVSASLAQK